MTKTGPNDASCVVWALDRFIIYNLYVNLFLYIYPPTRPWGTGLCGVQNCQPVPQPHENPQINPGVFATRANPYFRAIPYQVSYSCLMATSQVECQLYHEMMCKCIRILKASEGHVREDAQIFLGQFVLSCHF